MTECIQCTSGIKIHLYLQCSFWIITGNHYWPSCYCFHVCPQCMGALKSKREPSQSVLKAGSAVSHSAVDHFQLLFADMTWDRTQRHAVCLCNEAIVFLTAKAQTRRSASLDTLFFFKKWNEVLRAYQNIHALNFKISPVLWSLNNLCTMTENRESNTSL